MDVPGVDVKVDATADLTPAVKAGSDIATNTHKGVSKLFYALCGPWMEGRVRKAELIAAQTSKDCADIKNGLVTYTGENVIPFEPQATVASSFEALHKLNHASDAKRLHAAIQEAARQISEVPDEQVSDEPLSQDFFNHWRREAEMIDDVELRKWWARLLSEEARTPNSISARTLDVAKDLSKAEAQLFQRVLKGLISGCIPVAPNGHPQYINYAEALTLEDAGLVIAHKSTVLWHDRLLQGGEKTIVALPEKSNYVLCIDGGQIKISCFLLTAAGEQLAKMVLQERNAAGVIEIAKFLHGLHKDRKFVVHETWRSGSDSISWGGIPVWSSDGGAGQNLGDSQGVTK